MIGFFGGTFDPIHFGHLNLAESLKEREGLKEIWICPAWQSPFKKGVKTASPQDRLAMCKLAIEDFPGFKVIDTEIVRGGPSFTIDTIRSLKGSFRLILGDDQVKSFDQWKEADELKKLAPPLIGARFGEGIKTPIMEISATDIRNRLAKGLPCAHLVPHKVLDYIFKNGLYCSS